MRKALSDQVAKSAKAKPAPYQIHCTLIPGFLLRVQPSGRKFWKLKQGRSVVTLGAYPATTYGRARELALGILRGEEEAPLTGIPTLQAFLDRYYKPHLKAKHKSGDATLARLKSFPFGSMKLDSVTHAEVERWRDKRLAEGKSVATVNRDLGALKAALTKAVQWKLISTNPLSDLKPVREDKSGRPRYLEKDEERRLLEALKARDDQLRAERASGNEWRKQRGYELLPELGEYADRLTPMVLLALHTGLRRGELWNLRWGDVDLLRKVLTVHGAGAKSGQTRHVPLNKTALHVLKTWRGEVHPLPNVPVFGRHEFKTSWHSLLKRAKITEFRFHDCRHHFASKLVMAGVELNTVRELLGHGDITMTLRYAHLAPEHKHAAVELIG